MHGLVKTCLEMCAVDLTEVYSASLFNERSMQLGVSPGVAADMETGWNMDTKSRREPCPLFLTSQNLDDGTSIPLESEETKVRTICSPAAKIYWNSLMRTNRGFPSRDPFFVTQYLEKHSASSDQHMKKLM